ncbi:transposase domain-containing protein [Nocardia vinacea]|uniref:transposase domain-containing protein n=1 Tax=Nocardia vinacea TaxID=96468 RepID=UPI0033E4924B
MLESKHGQAELAPHLESATRPRCHPLPRKHRHIALRVTVDEVLAECGATQQRLRKLPARVVVYLLLAAALFTECGYLAVWSKLTAALGSVPIPKITATALWHARARLGMRPLCGLFDLLRGPASAIRTAGARWTGLLVVAIDGTYLDVPDDPATRARLGKGRNQYATSGYPQICLVALVAPGTRAVIDAIFGPRTQGEITHGHHLMRSLNPGMIVLLDRGFASNTTANSPTLRANWPTATGSR